MITNDNFWISNSQYDHKFRIHFVKSVVSKNFSCRVVVSQCHFCRGTDPPSSTLNFTYNCTVNCACTGVFGKFPGNFPDTHPCPPPHPPYFKWIFILVVIKRILFYPRPSPHFALECTYLCLHPYIYLLITMYRPT